jgi:hypothetical protein
LSRPTIRSYIKAQEEGPSAGQAESVLDDDWLAALAARLHASTGRPRGAGRQRCEELQEYISKKLEANVRLDPPREG